MRAHRKRILVTVVTAVAAASLATVAMAGPAAAPSKRPVKTVLVKDSFFKPKVARVTPGTKVTWAWKGDGHTVTFRSRPAGVGPIKGTGLRDTGSRFSHVFHTKGTYRYVCRVHVDLGMTGRVVVQSRP